MDETFAKIGCRVLEAHDENASFRSQSVDGVGFAAREGKRAHDRSQEPSRRRALATKRDLPRRDDVLGPYGCPVRPGRRGIDLEAPLGTPAVVRFRHPFGCHAGSGFPVGIPCQQSLTRGRDQEPLQVVPRRPRLRRPSAGQQDPNTASRFRSGSHGGRPRSGRDLGRRGRVQRSGSAGAASCVNGCAGDRYEDDRELRAHRVSKLTRPPGGGKGENSWETPPARIPRAGKSRRVSEPDWRDR